MACIAVCWQLLRIIERSSYAKTFPPALVRGSRSRYLTSSGVLRAVINPAPLLHLHSKEESFVRCYPAFASTSLPSIEIKEDEEDGGATSLFIIH